MSFLYSKFGQACCRGLSMKITTQNQFIHTSARVFAGHSKWANIRHNKAAQDTARSSYINKMSLLMRGAIREGGSADPKLNTRLEQLVNMAKQNDVPNKTIENILSSAKKASDNSEPVLLDLQGSHGVFMVVNVLTDNRKRARMLLNAATKKTGLVDGRGVGLKMFVEKGVILTEIGERTLEEATDDAIVFGAEDCEIEEDQFRFTCHPYEFMNLNKGLEESKYTITYSSMDYLPNMYVDPPEEVYKSIEKCSNNIDTYMENVLGVYVNV